MQQMYSTNSTLDSKYTDSRGIWREEGWKNEFSLFVSVERFCDILQLCQEHREKKSSLTERTREDEDTMLSN